MLKISPLANEIQICNLQAHNFRLHLDNLMYQITFREGIIIGTSIYGNIQGRTRLNTSEASNRY